MTQTGPPVDGNTTVPEILNTYHLYGNIHYEDPYLFLEECSNKALALTRANWYQANGYNNVRIHQHNRCLDVPIANAENDQGIIPIGLDTYLNCVVPTRAPMNNPLVRQQPPIGTQVEVDVTVQ